MTAAEHAPSVPNDAELIAAARVGGDEAYAELYRRHGHSARAAALGLTRSSADADDLVSEAFSRVLHALRAGRGPEIAFRPYLLTTVRNVFYDRVRKDRRVDVRAEVPDDVNAALLQQSASSEDRSLVAHAFSTLPERWQLVLWHTEVEGRSVAEVAPLLGLAPNAVAALAYRAREGLRQAYLQAHLRQPTPSGCAESRSKLGAHVRGALSARDDRKVEEHLAQCERCSALLLELNGANAQLRVVLVPLIVGVPAAKYLAVLGGGKSVGALFRRAGRSSRIAATAVAAAIVLVVAIVAASALGGGERQEVASSPGSPATPSASPSATERAVSSTAATATSVASAGPVPPSPAGTSTISTVATTASPVLAPQRPSPMPTTAPRATQPAAASSTTAPSTTPPPTTAPPTTVPPTSAVPTTSIVATGPPPVPVPPSLSVSASAGGPFVAGHYGYVDLTVGNAAGGAGGVGNRRSTGPVGPAVAPVVTLPLPAGVELAEIDAPGWACRAAASTLSCALPRLEAGASSRAAIELRLAPTVGVVIELTPSVASNGLAARVGPTLGITVAPGTDLAFHRILRGGIIAIGNTSMTCAELLIGQCAAAQQGTAAGDGNLRQRNNMVMVGGDEKAGVLNSSSAVLTLPAGATIERALLVWGGDLAGGDLGRPATGKPDGIVFAGPAGSRPVVADVVRFAPDAASVYYASADVTAAVTASGRYTVSGVQAGTGMGRFAGWSLFVAYRDAASPRALVALVDQHATLGATPTLVSVNGIAPVAGAREVTVTWTAQEGDLTLAQEDTELGGAPLMDALGRPDDVFNSSIVGERSPAFANNFGVDVDRITASVDGRAASVTLSFTSERDLVRVGAVAFVVAL